MNQKLIWNENWQFCKQGSEQWEAIALPHTWNGVDGQDGGNDYFRGTCQYRKQLKKSELPECADVYLEMEGVNSIGEVFVNGVSAGKHEGGYSTWRVNITNLIKEDNEILITVDNGPSDHVYPQMADFTFYGGIYRTVSILCVGETRFELDYFGGPAVKVTPVVKGAEAEVEVEAWFTGLKGEEVLHLTVLDGECVVAEANVPAKEGKAVLVIPEVHLWHGRKDPFLYRLKAELLASQGGEVLDERALRFGCRTFKIDPELGFFLNGESYPLRGVSRHQDRPEIGNALLPCHHEEDMDLICEVGANTIRLAHYQHDQYFYDLCDERGMVIWAEIPYISSHLPAGKENTLSQMQELIIQNYHHPSIVVWGLSNEITMGGADDPSLLDNHYALNDLCHKLDPTRLTTQAIVTMCSMDAEYVRIPDVMAYNHYFGWYGGETDMNGEFMDKFHAKYPNVPIGMSEYGCEALNWHTSDPVQGDYTEEYQAYYHEELIKQLFTRPYIWGTYCWNMFDFAADARSEGGEDGMNHKGLMTFDRKYKKDAFYAYKAWLSDEPFVHLCGKRYVNRVEAVTKVTVYSNQPSVELFANGVSLGCQESENHFFYFNVPNEGETILEAKAGACTDESRIVKVEVFDESYRMKETGDVLNWFEITAPEGYFSINDKISDILASKKAKNCMKWILIGMALKHAKVLLGMKKGGGGGGFKVDKDEIMKMVGGFTIKRALSMVGMIGPGMKISKAEALKMNRKLNRIKK